NTTAVTTLTSTDPESDTRSYALTAGDDVGLFALDAATGVLSFKSAPDYEKPLDANKDNKYELVAKATDSNGGSTTQAITVTVTNVKESTLSITSNGGESTALISLKENTTDVTTVTSSDSEGATRVYAIVEGGDGALFTIDANSGKVSFKNKPDFENPKDANKDNTYTLRVTVTDGNGAIAWQDIRIAVTDVDDTPPITKITKTLRDATFNKDYSYYEITGTIELKSGKTDDISISIDVLEGIKEDKFEIRSTVVDPKSISFSAKVSLKRSEDSSRYAQVIIFVSDRSNLVLIPMSLDAVRILSPKYDAGYVYKDTPITVRNQDTIGLQLQQADSLITTIKASYEKSNPQGTLFANRQVSIGATVSAATNIVRGGNSALDGWDAATFTLMGVAAVWARNARRPAARSLNALPVNPN
ncbi:MAG: cadherin domain-containing protein, partial [Magnetococcales bacterium]|nr:cadherin domain-containing protein [Magnetococcales bacterium]